MVCEVFHTLGIPVFKADEAARYLMEHDEPLINAISGLLGDEVYTAGVLNREKVADIIYKQPEKLLELNKLVHPATKAYCGQWMDKQVAPYIIKESAILFESGTDKDVDIITGVYAPIELRIKRVMQRSGSTRERVLDIVAKQMNEEEKMKMCHHIITNDDVTAVLPQVLSLHELFIEQLNAGQ